MSTLVIDIDACCLCVRRDYDLRRVLQRVDMRWVKMLLKDPYGVQYERWHAGCGSRSSWIWRDMSKLGTLDLDDMPTSYRHNYHTEWETRIEKMRQDILVKHICNENVDADELVEVQLKYPGEEYEIETIQ